MLIFHFAIIFWQMFKSLITLPRFFGMWLGGGGGGRICIIKVAAKSEHENLMEFYDTVGVRSKFGGVWGEG